ncbi:hypothetical protein B7989_07140 [Fibrobacter sp. UWB5]|nr:hypothetical protein B7989_07140 [Fibrobacter sp. UWB5]
MTIRSLFVAFLFSMAAVFWACSDDDSSVEFRVEREVSDISTLLQCAKGADSGAYCFMVRFRYPDDTESLDSIYLWVGNDVLDDTSKSVGDKEKSKATDRFAYPSKTEELFDTIDVTPYIQDYVEERESLMVALYCDYSGGRPGTVQRIYLYFGDKLAPSDINISDSTWTTGALLEWTRPTDQTNHYKPNELSGPILGYNIRIYSENKNEDLRKLKVKLESPDGIDSTGETLYLRHKGYHSNVDSVFLQSKEHGDSRKNELFLAIPDGKGYNNDNPDSNIFRLTIEGLKAETEYKIGYSTWDTCGNYTGVDRSDMRAWLTINTTDSVAPLMPTKIFTMKDTLYPEMARLDSNNRLLIFWSQSVDPYKREHDIEVDTVLSIPDTCLVDLCYEKVEMYRVEYWDRYTEQWVISSDVDTLDRYTKFYKPSGDTMKVSATGKFISDTIRYVAPGDTLVLRIIAIDESGYWSVPLIDTIAVSPGAIANEIECPEGFVAVKASDTNYFCMERMEHQNDSGEFMTNVLHSEALATCEAISASGFKVSLCNERDWELVCLSGGTLAYGVVQDDTVETAEFLFKYCNVATNDSASAANPAKRSSRCMNPMGIRDLPGQYQEWVRGRSEDTIAVVKGGSYRVMSGLESGEFGRETQALCTNRYFPYFTRLAYTTDSVYLYREGTRVDTVYTADTSRTLYKVLTKKDFKDTLQFFDIQDSSGNSVGTDYVPYAEYKQGGDEWLETISNGMKYVPDHIEVVFLTGERVAYRGASNYYRSSSIGFRCCAYKEQNEE